MADLDLLANWNCRNGHNWTTALTTLSTAGVHRSTSEFQIPITFCARSHLTGPTVTGCPQGCHSNTHKVGSEPPCPGLGVPSSSAYPHGWLVQWAEYQCLEQGDIRAYHTGCLGDKGSLGLIGVGSSAPSCLTRIRREGWDLCIDAMHLSSAWLSSAWLSTACSFTRLHGHPACQYQQRCSHVAVPTRGRPCLRWRCVCAEPENTLMGGATTFCQEEICKTFHLVPKKLHKSCT